MALRALMTKKKLEEKKKELENQRAIMADFLVREADLEKSIEEAATDEEKAVVEEEINKYEAEKAEAEEKEKSLSAEVETLEKELADVEAEQDKEPAKEVSEERKKEFEKEERRGATNMITREMFEKHGIEIRNGQFADENLTAWVNEYRSAIKEKRAIQGVGLTIPVNVLPLLRQNIFNYSKLLRRVNLVSVSGEAKQPIMGELPEGIWTECCSNLNELTMSFSDWTMDCFKIAGYVPVCNANLEDSDVDLAAEILNAIGQALAKGIDKSILFGRNTTNNVNMPQGILPSLEQTSQPAGYPTTARPWVDLHSTNIVAVGSQATPVSGVDLVKGIILASGVTTNDYARGAITWVMNDKTYKSIVAESLSVNAAGAIVAGVNATMPVVGGDIEVLNFVPDGVIIFGYFDLYTMAQRAGAKFASSEHVRFLQDQTVYKATARYDGAPIIREGFGAIGLNGADVDSTDVLFPQDTANPTSI